MTRSKRSSGFLPQNPSMSPQQKTIFDIYRLFCGYWPLAALIIAVARPQKRNDQQQTQGEGIDIVLCMDVSGSMGSRDILPSRMDVAKEVAVEFVLSRPVDRIGLVIFSGESFTQMSHYNR